MDTVNTIKGKKVAILVADGFEQVEFTKPRDVLEAAGAETVVVSLKAGKVQGVEHGEKLDTFEVDRTVSEVSSDDFDALFLPGGVINPDTLRADEEAVAFTRSFFEQGKPVFAICHGPQVLVNADVVRGRRLTSWPSLRKDLENAGATWIDKEVVVDEGLVTSRNPDDIPAFNRRIVEELTEGVHSGQHA